MSPVPGNGGKIGVLSGNRRETDKGWMEEVSLGHKGASGFLGESAVLCRRPELVRSPGEWLGGCLLLENLRERPRCQVAQQRGEDEKIL